MDARRCAGLCKAPAKPEKAEKTFPRRQELHWEEDTEGAMGGMATTPIPAAPESGEAMLPWMQRGTEPAEEKDEVSSWINGHADAPQESAPGFSICHLAQSSRRPPAN